MDTYTAGVDEKPDNGLKKSKDYILKVSGSQRLRKLQIVHIFTEFKNIVRFKRRENRNFQVNGSLFCAALVHDNTNTWYSQIFRLGVLYSFLNENW